MIDLLSSTRRLLHHARLGGALLALAVVACGAQSSPSTSRGLAGLADTGVATASDTEFDTAPGDYLAGNFAVDSGRLGEAADYFQRALEADPNNLDLLRQLFLLTLASGRYDAAIDQARSLVPRDPEADEARLLQAMEQVRAGKFDDARTALKGLGAEGVAGLTAPFLDAWAIFGAGGPAATDAALARLGQGESLGPLNGYHKAMMLDLGGRLDDAAKALGEAMPGNGPAPVRIVQAYASILTRHGERDTAIKAVREQVSDGRELPVLVDLLATLEAGGSPAPPFTDAAGGMADALLGIAEALHQERGNSRAIVYARLAMYVRPDLVDRRRVRCRGRGGPARVWRRRPGPSWPSYGVCSLRGGRLLLSVPNFANWYPVARVLSGTWGYDTRGLLNTAQLRHFTGRQVDALLDVAGLDVRRREVVGLPVDPDQSRAVAAIDVLGLAVGPSLFAYEYLYEVVPHPA